MLTEAQLLITVTMVALGTVFTRFLPFVLFPENKETPQYVVYLGKVLPFAVIAFLVVFCLKSVSILSNPHGIPEALAIGCIVLLHLWKNNTLFSIGSGTILYMVLVQTVFI